MAASAAQITVTTAQGQVQYCMFLLLLPAFDAVSLFNLKQQTRKTVLFKMF